MLNEKIKSLRQSYRLNQVELGKALGVTKQCVSNWENDNIQPSVEMLVKLAKFFNVSADYLLDIDGVEVGDTVCVMTDQGKTEVIVAAILEKAESELALPINKYKKIIEKV